MSDGTFLQARLKLATTATELSDVDRGHIVDFFASADNMIPQIVTVGVATSVRRRRLDLSVPVSVDVSQLIHCNSDHVEDYRCGVLT